MWVISKTIINHRPNSEATSLKQIRHSKPGTFPHTSSPSTPICSPKNTSKFPFLGIHFSAYQNPIFPAVIIPRLDGGHRLGRFAHGAHQKKFQRHISHKAHQGGQQNGGSHEALVWWLAISMALGGTFFLSRKSPKSHHHMSYHPSIFWDFP